MKVLLRRNVSHVGIIGDVVEVKPGYARNYLIPQGLAIEPTEANVRAVEAEKERYLAELARLKAEVEARAKIIEGKEVTITSRTNEEGHLYGSVGPAQIVAAFAEQGVMLDAKNIRLVEPIRQIGRYEAPVDLGHDVHATVFVLVQSEGGLAEKAIAEKAAAEQAALQGEDQQPQEQ